MGTSGDHVAVLGEESVLTGRFVGKDLTVLGRFEGELEIKGLLRVGRQARVKAIVRAAAVEVDGEFDGEIRAGSLAFGQGARARGVFVSDRLRIHEGARVDGALNLPPEPRPVAATPATQAAEPEGQLSANPEPGIAEAGSGMTAP